MDVPDEQLLSAIVVLRPPSGKLNGAAAITAANIQDFATPARAAAEAVRVFSSMGFEVGPLVGISFSISGPAGLFARTFETALRQAQTGAVSAADGGGAVGDLPLDSLPQTLSDLVAAVTFPPPPQFGPRSYNC